MNMYENRWNPWTSKTICENHQRFVQIMQIHENRHPWKSTKIELKSWKSAKIYENPSGSAKREQIVVSVRVSSLKREWIGSGRSRRLGRIYSRVTNPVPLRAPGHKRANLTTFHIPAGSYITPSAGIVILFYSRFVFIIGKGFPYTSRNSYNTFGWYCTSVLLQILFYNRKRFPLYQPDLI